MIKEKLKALLKVNERIKIGRYEYITDYQFNVFNMKIQTKTFLFVRTKVGLYAIDFKSNLSDFEVGLNENGKLFIYDDVSYKVKNRSKIFNYYVLEKLNKFAIMKNDLKSFESKNIDFVIK